MVDRNLIEDLKLDGEMERMLLEAGIASVESGDMDGLISSEVSGYAPGAILKGHVVGFSGDFVVVEVGLKSEGLIDRNEFDDTDVAVGDLVEVLLESLEDETGGVRLSKRKADRIRGWENILLTRKEGDVIEGKCVRKIKGGLLVDIGVPVFLPASQVDVRRPGDIGEFVGKPMRAMILKIDEERRNIVISRRKLIEDERDAAKKRLLENVREGDLVRGMITNVADFGAFVDLGGIDGLLHITDMSWGRIGHPSEMVQIDQEIEVQVLHIDREREKIALGMKQRTASPWAKVADKYPVGTVCKGTVVNVMSYGAFVKLEDGVEGLVHISEMSWTKRVSHPSELVKPGDEVEVVVLAINKEKQEISLGMKQTQQNPWEKVAADYPPGAIVKGVVRNLTNYGAFIEIDDGIDGLLHVTDMSWTRKVTHPSEMVDKGQEIECKVLSVDQQRRRIALGLKQMADDPWTTDIPKRYKAGDIVKGAITKITNFGVFVGLEDGLEGLLHISELSEDKIENAEEVVKVGDPIEVKILRVDTDDRKIGLSKKRVGWSAEREAAEAAEEVSVAHASRRAKTAAGTAEGFSRSPSRTRA